MPRVLLCRVAAGAGPHLSRCPRTAAPHRNRGRGALFARKVHQGGRFCKHSTDKSPFQRQSSLARSLARTAAGRRRHGARHARGTGNRRSLTTGSRSTRSTWRALRRATARLRSPHTSSPTRMVGKLVNVGVAALQISSRVRPPKQDAGGPGSAASAASETAAGCERRVPGETRAPRRLLLGAARGRGRRAGRPAGAGGSGTSARHEE